MGELNRQFVSIAAKENVFINEKVQAAIDLYKALGEGLKKTGPQHDAKVAQLREALKEVAEVKAEVKAHVAALEQTQEELDMAEEPTDFGAALEEATGQLAEDHRGLAAAELREFDEAVAGGEDIEEDDDLQIERGGDIAPNAACPISSIGIMDIKEPVVDQKGFVYEKKFIRDHIRGNGVNGEVRCPHHGTNHTVSMETLREARAVIRAQRQHRRREELRSQNPDADADDGVLDID